MAEKSTCRVGFVKGFVKGFVRVRVYRIGLGGGGAVRERELQSRVREEKSAAWLLIRNHLWGTHLRRLA